MLAELLSEHKVQIENTLKVGRANWDEIIKRIRDQEKSKKPNFHDEQVWTFLTASAYAICGADGARTLARTLTERQVSAESTDKIWFEVLPIPPRIKERNTNLDLAVGNIEERHSGSRKTDGSQQQRQEWGSGIQYDGFESGYVCFCECKWHSDIDVKVTHDLHRNQLIRVIENALCFQKKNSRQPYPEQVHVTLITPEVFKSRHPWSRFYSYKYDDYKNDPQKILADIEGCCPSKNDKRSDFGYPENITERIAKLRLHWVTYDELIANIPESSIKEAIHAFYKSK